MVFLSKNTEHCSLLSSTIPYFLVMEPKNDWSATFGGRLRREVAQFFRFCQRSHEEFLKKSGKKREF